MQDGLLLFGDWTGPPAYIRAYAMSILRLVSMNFNLKRSKRNEERVRQEVMETQRTEKQGYREKVEKQIVERMQQLHIQRELLRSKVEVQLDEAEKEFQCVDREPELSNSKGEGERERVRVRAEVMKDCKRYHRLQQDLHRN